MTKKLLHITLRKYILFSIVVLVLSAPIFYFSIYHLYLEETDESMELHHEEFVNSKSLSVVDIPQWNKFNRDVKIESGYIKSEPLFYTKECFDSLDNELEPYRFYEAKVEIEGKVFRYSERKNLIETEDLMFNVLFLFIGIIVLLLVGLIILTNRISLSLWQGFHSTLKIIEDFEIDKNNDLQLEATNIEEFQRLNSSIESLAKKNRLIYRNQREFVENAAHELQTPLAVFQAKIETLLQSEHLSEEHFQIIDSLNASIYNLNRLNKNLLLLSKLDNNGFEGKESIALKKNILKRLPFFKEQANAKNVKIEEYLEKNLTLNTNPALVEILLNNLILNAVQHTPENGMIEIKIHSNSLMITNSSFGESLNQERLFQRFSKAISNKSGNGLGLAIVKKICDVNCWEISYSFEEGRHCFEVKFSV